MAGSTEQHPTQDAGGGVATDSTPTVATLKAIVTAFNAHDLTQIMSFFAHDCVLEMPRGPDPWGKRMSGKAEVRNGLQSRFDGIPDVRYEEDTHLVSGNVGVSQWTLRGTPLSGQPIVVRGCDFYTFRGGKIVKKDSYWKIVER
jgi:ketosteroid isomerase-like protein